MLQDRRAQITGNKDDGRTHFDPLVLQGKSKSFHKWSDFVVFFLYKNDETEVSCLRLR